MNLKMRIRCFLPLLCMLLLPACDVIEYHPYDGRVSGKTGINAANVARIEAACRERDTIRFAVISDTQRWYDETHAAVNTINALPGIDFVVHCGDLSDFGMTREFEWMRDELERLRMPYVACIGNHDCLGSGPDVFRKIFGEPNFSFCAGKAAFVCLNTNAFEYDYSVPVPDFDFLRGVRKALPDSIAATLVFMHAAPFSDQFNNNVAHFFQEEMKHFPGFLGGVYGHTHRTSVDDLFGDGITYYQSSCAKHREGLLFTLVNDSLAYEVLHY